MLNFKKRVSLNLQKVFDISKNVKKVMCEVNTNDYTFNDIKSAAIDLFTVKASMVKSTYRQVADNYVSFVLMPNKISKPYDKTKYKTISSDIISDIQDNSIWKVVDVDGEKRIVLIDDQNFNNIFKASTRISTFAAMYEPPKAAINDYVSFYSIKSNALVSGIVTEAEDDTSIIIDRNCKYHRIKNNAIIDVADMHNSSLNQCLSNLTETMGDNVLSYYKMLYDNTAFFDKLDELVGIDVKSNKGGDTMTIQSALLDEDTINNMKDVIKDYFINNIDNEEDVGNTEGDFDIDVDPMFEGDDVLEFVVDENDDLETLEDVPSADVLTPVETPVIVDNPAITDIGVDHVAPVTDIAPVAPAIPAVEPVIPEADPAMPLMVDETIPTIDMETPVAPTYNPSDIIVNPDNSVTRQEILPSQKDNIVPEDELSVDDLIDEVLEEEKKELGDNV